MRTTARVVRRTEPWRGLAVVLGVLVLGSEVSCSKGLDGGGDCELGTERCRCFENATCFEPLICASGMCVVDPAGAGEAGAGGVREEGAGTTAAPMGTPCEACIGTTLCLDPGSAICGGSDCIGIGERTVCSRDCETDEDCASAETELWCVDVCDGGGEEALAFLGKCVTPETYEVLNVVFCNG
jgi:hypothetical protein